MESRLRDMFGSFGKVTYILSMLAWTVLLVAIAAKHYTSSEGIAMTMVEIIANQTHGPPGDGIVVSGPWQALDALLWSQAKTEMIHYGGIWLLGLIGLTFARTLFVRKNREQERVQMGHATPNQKSTSILESISDAFVLLDQNLVIRYCNAAAEQTFHKGKDELVGKPFFGVLPTFANGSFEACLLGAQKEKSARSIELRVEEGSNENWHEVNVYPHDEGIVIHTKVITERKRAEAALKENEALLTLILDASPAATALTVNRIVKWANETWVEMFGLQDKRESIGLDSRTLYPDEENYERAGQIYYQLSDGGTANTEVLMKRRDGSVFDAALYFRAVDPADLSKGVISAILDISDKKQLERERGEMQRKVFHAEKLESLSVMAGGIAHQFNNLLQVIMGNLELLQMDAPHSARSAALIDSAFKASRRAAKLSVLMLDYTGQTPFISGDVDVNDIVGRAEQLLSSVVSRNVQFVVERGEVLHAVSGGPAQIEQIILSLVTNASEAVGDGPGEIRLITGEMYCDESYLATTRQELSPSPGQYVFIEVSDTGHGMDAGALERVFDPFYTTKFMGRGLGMPAVLGIVRGHKGGIRITSEPGKGTTVRVLLPAGAESKARVDSDKAKECYESSIKAFPESGAKVLMVDDDQTVLQLGADLLASLGYDGLTTLNGDEAIKLCTEPGNEIGCVIVDISPPKTDGLLTLRELKHRRPDLKIIVSSGFSEPEAMLMVGELDVVAFLTKPYDLETFKAVLEKAQRRVC